eukprot:762407-Hanusia_phi.AAC.2
MDSNTQDIIIAPLGVLNLFPWNCMLNEQGDSLLLRSPPPPPPPSESLPSSSSKCPLRLLPYSWRADTTSRWSPASRPLPSSSATRAKTRRSPPPPPPSSPSPCSSARTRRSPPTYLPSLSSTLATISLRGIVRRKTLPTARTRRGRRRLDEGIGKRPAPTPPLPLLLRLHSISHGAATWLKSSRRRWRAWVRAENWRGWELTPAARVRKQGCLLLPLDPRLCSCRAGGERRTGSVPPVGGLPAVRREGLGASRPSSPPPRLQRCSKSPRPPQLMTSPRRTLRLLSRHSRLRPQRHAGGEAARGDEPAGPCAGEAAQGKASAACGRGDAISGLARYGRLLANQARGAAPRPSPCSLSGASGASGDGQHVQQYHPRAAALSQHPCRGHAAGQPGHELGTSLRGTRVPGERVICGYG